ncbi:MAG: OmpA family protein [Bacteroidota bacterium]
MSRPLAWLLGLAGLAVLTLLCVWTNAPGIERDLQERTTAVLDERGFTGTGAALSGRDVTLRGGVPSEDARMEALAAARAVPGVRVVHDELRIARDDGASTGGPALFSLSDGPGGALVARGTVPDDASRQSLLSRIQEAFPGRSVENELEVGPGGAGWQSAVEALLPGLGAVQSPSVSVEPAVAATAGMDGSTVVLRGRVPSEVAKAEVEAAASAVVRPPYLFRSELAVGESASEDTSEPSADPTDVSGADPSDLQAAEAALQSALSGGPITFELATADLTASSRRVLDGVAEVLDRYPAIRAEVEGHTDNEDSSEHNLRLSQQRADAVRAYLIDAGIAAERLSARGIGEDQPIASNDTADGRARNRRVEFNLQR